MDELDIFAAIGGVEEELLNEQPRRLLPRRCGLIAAVLALAVLTACAAPVVVRTFNAISGGEAEQTRQSHRVGSMVLDNQTGAFIISGSWEMEPAEYEITLELEGEGRRPQELEERYAPTWVPEDYVNQFDNSEEGNAVLRFCTLDSPDAWLRYVEFRQSLLPEGDPVTFTDTFSVFRGVFVNGMDSRNVTYGEATVLELYPRLTELELENIHAFFFQASRYLYWSDGAYLFRLEIPYEMDTDTVERIIASVQIVEN